MCQFVLDISILPSISSPKSSTVSSFHLVILEDGILPEWCFQSLAISQSDLQEHYREGNPAMPAGQSVPTNRDDEIENHTYKPIISSELL